MSRIPFSVAVGIVSLCAASPSFAYIDIPAYSETGEYDSVTNPVSDEAAGTIHFDAAMDTESGRQVNRPTFDQQQGFDQIPFAVRAGIGPDPLYFFDDPQSGGDFILYATLSGFNKHNFSLETIRQLTLENTDGIVGPVGLCDSLSIDDRTRCENERRIHQTYSPVTTNIETQPNEHNTNYNPSKDPPLFIAINPLPNYPGLGSSEYTNLSALFLPKYTTATPIDDASLPAAATGIIDDIPQGSPEFDSFVPDLPLQQTVDLPGDPIGPIVEIPAPAIPEMSTFAMLFLGFICTAVFSVRRVPARKL